MLEGQQIGPLVLREQVDSGEFAAVYRAEHAVLGSVHALKLLHPEQEQPIVDSLHIAARLQASVVHPNIVRVLDAATWNGRPWLSMDWVEGRSLEGWLEAHGALSVDRAVSLFRGVVRGVHALHHAGIVHRDLKSSNVLVAVERGRQVPKVNDLGLAKQLRPGEEPRAEGLSVEYRTLGTPEYMAPEQVLRVGEVDTRADLWSLGVVLYELLTDALPFDGERPADIHRLTMAGHYAPARTHTPAVPQQLEDVIAELLMPDPGDRLATTGLLLQHLDGA